MQSHGNSAWTGRRTQAEPGPELEHVERHAELQAELHVVLVEFGSCLLRQTRVKK